MSLVGASPAELQAAARELDEAAAWVDASGRDLSNSLGALSWAGAAALAFTDVWSTRHKPALQSTSAYLRDHANRLRQQAQQQLDASSGAGAASSIGKGGAASGGGEPTRPPYGPRPAGNKAWWDSLGDRQAWVEKHHPEWIGNMDGVPADVRDRANRAILDSRIKALAEDIAAQGAGSDSPLMHTFLELTAVREALKCTQSNGQTITDRQLLLLDDSGPIVRAAISCGLANVSEHVSVYTPGMDTTAADLVDKVRDMDKLRSTAQSMNQGSVATVVWLGYQTPNGYDATDLGLAQAGAGPLESFLTGINTSRPDGVHLTALGHSYGSTTTALAIDRLEPGVVDQAVFFGSPGLANADLSAVGGESYFLEARGDGVADAGSVNSASGAAAGGGIGYVLGGPGGAAVGAAVGGALGSATKAEMAEFGGDPAKDARLVHLSSEGSRGHSAYLDPGSVSQTNIAAVITGNPYGIRQG